MEEKKREMQNPHGPEQIQQPTFTELALPRIFPHDTASSGLAPESLPSYSWAVLMKTAKSAPFRIRFALQIWCLGRPPPRMITPVLEGVAYTASPFIPLISATIWYVSGHLHIFYIKCNGIFKKKVHWHQASKTVSYLEQYLWQDLGCGRSESRSYPLMNHRWVQDSI